MLQKMSERIHGVFAWVLIILISATFAMFGIEYYFNTYSIKQTAVEVNGQAIDKQDFDLFLRRVQQGHDPVQWAEVATQQTKDILDGMIVRMVTLQSADKNGFLVTEKQLDNAIFSIPEFQQQGQFSTDKYMQTLRANLFTPAEFNNEIRQGMEINQQRFAFIGTSFALPNEINMFVKLFMQMRNYDYIEINSAEFMNKAKVSDSEIESYYKQHQQDFIKPAEVSIEYVTLSMIDIKNKIRPTETEIKNYYKENKSSYVTPARWQVSSILYPLSPTATDTERESVKNAAESQYKKIMKSPSDFASANKLKVIVSGKSDLDKSLINYTKKGELTAPILTKDGYQIFKIVEFIPAKTKSLKDVEASIKEQLITEKAQADYSQAVDELSELSYQTPDTLQPVVEKMKLTRKSFGPFANRDYDSGITKSRALVNAAFSHDVLQGNNSELIQLDNDCVIVLRVIKNIPEAQKPLAEVKPEIVKILKTQLAHATASAFGEKLLAYKDVNSAQFKNIVDAQKLKWHKVANAKRESTNAPAAINKLAFSIVQPKTMRGAALDNGNFAIVLLKSIKSGQSEDLDREKLASIAQQLEASLGTMEYELYVGSLLKSATIKRN